VHDLRHPASALLASITNTGKDPYYPAKLPSAKMLEFYAQQFDTVEPNNSFYRLPDASA
jgi:uncharacterized protein YecE (DUF72 family)